MLEELNLEYRIQAWQRDVNFRAPAEAKQVHPLGRFPMVEVDGEVLAESGAVLEYFAEREGRLRPGGPAERRQYTFFMHYAEGSLMPPLLVQLLVDRIKQATLPFFIKPVARSIAGKLEQNYSGPALELHLGFVEQTLAERHYFAGEQFSMADIQMIYPVEAALSRTSAGGPNLLAWRQRVTARDAYRRAEAKGGPAMPSE